MTILFVDILIIIYNMNLLVNAFNAQILLSTCVLRTDACLQCNICMEDFQLDERVRSLPCKHIYHGTCIVPWLELVRHWLQFVIKFVHFILQVTLNCTVQCYNESWVFLADPNLTQFHDNGTWCDCFGVNFLSDARHVSSMSSDCMAH